MSFVRGLFIMGIAGLLLAANGWPVRAQPPAGGPTTGVLVNLTVKPDADRSQLMKVMPDEVRATVKLFLDGKIQQWFSRSDGRGVLLILNTSTVADARALMDDLPLSKAGLDNLEFTAVGPLMPLRALMAPPGNGGRQ